VLLGIISVLLSTDIIIDFIDRLRVDSWTRKRTDVYSESSLICFNENLLKMIDAVSFRLRIGLFFPGRIRFQRKINSENCNSVRFNAFRGLVLCALLIIGGVELNPGPTEEITLKDLWDQLVPLCSLPDDMAGLKRSIEKLTASFGAIQDDLKVLRNRCQTLEVEKNELAAKLDRLEGHSRRNNLVFYNIAEQERENWKQTETLVKKMIEEQMGVQLHENDIERAHRLGRRRDKSRPIIVKFSNFKVKSEILFRRTTLKGTKIRLDEDFTERVRSIRNKLTDFMFRARKDGRRAYIRFDRLVVDGQQYSLEDLEAGGSMEACSFRARPQFSIGDEVRRIPSSLVDDLSSAGFFQNEENLPGRKKQNDKGIFTGNGRSERAVTDTQDRLSEMREAESVDEPIAAGRPGTVERLQDKASRRTRSGEGSSSDGMKETKAAEMRSGVVTRGRATATTNCSGGGMKAWLQQRETAPAAVQHKKKSSILRLNSQ
jgi:hypothetical protein